MIQSPRQCTVCKAYDGFHSRHSQFNDRLCLPSHAGERASHHFYAAVLIVIDERGLCQLHAKARDMADAQKSAGA